MQKKQFLDLRLDDMVTITLLAVCIIASMAFVVKYKNHVPCTDFNIQTSSRQIIAGAAVRFETNAKGFRRLKWDFGDQQNAVSELSSVFHAFERPGSYTVALSVDGRCTQYINLVVIAAPEIVDSSLMAEIVMPDSVEINVPITIKDTSKRATSWKWINAETNEVIGNTREFQYTFNSTGRMSIIAIINNNFKVPAIKRINITPKKIVEKLQIQPIVKDIPDEPITPPIGDQQKDKENTEKDSIVQIKQPPKETVKPVFTGFDFAALTRSAVGGKRSQSDFITHFCNANPNTMVNLNGRVIPFGEFYKKIADLKKGDKANLELTCTLFKSPEGCVERIEVIGAKRTGVLRMHWVPL